MLTIEQTEFIDNSLRYLKAGKLGAMGSEGCVYHDVSQDKFCIVGCNLPESVFTQEFYDYLNSGTVLAVVLRVIEWDAPFTLDELYYLQYIHDAWAENQSTKDTQLFVDILEKIKKNGEIPRQLLNAFPRKQDMPDIYAHFIVYTAKNPQLQSFQ